MQLLANTTSPFVRIARVAMLEKGLQIEPTLVDPWADDVRLRTANVATRVPTLVLDDGTPLTESLLIVQWLEAAYANQPSLLGQDAAQKAGILARAGVALGAIEASVHTIITRKVTAPVLFDETPVGLRRRRTMIEGMQRLDGLSPAIRAGRSDAQLAAQTPSLDIICAVTLFDYQMLRYSDQVWLPKVPALQAVAEAVRLRTSFAQTMPRMA